MEGSIACTGGVSIPGTVAAVWLVVAGVGQIEHDQKMLRPAQGEVHVAAAAQLQPLQRRAAGRHGFAHDGGEALEAFLGDRGQQLVLAGEVTVGGVVGDAGAAGDLAQGEGARAASPMRATAASSRVLRRLT